MEAQLDMTAEDRQRAAILRSAAADSAAGVDVALAAFKREGALAAMKAIEEEHPDILQWILAQEECVVAGSALEQAEASGSRPVIDLLKRREAAAAQKANAARQSARENGFDSIVKAYALFAKVVAGEDPLT